MQTQRTLYEDWELRQERLYKAPLLPHFDEQAAVLNYLLSRYRDDPVAHQPAKFPLPSQLFLNSRQIIVHHHLKCGEFAGTRDAADAHKRARLFLERIASENPQASLGPPNAGSSIPHEAAELSAATPQAAGGAEAERNRIGDFILRCQADLKSTGSLTKPQRESLQSLLPCLLRDVDAIFALLSGSATNDIVRALLDTWLNQTCSPEIHSRIEAFLKSNENTTDVLRAELANEFADARRNAALILGQLGTLDDIGLLHDLLALPETEVDSRERQAYLSAMKDLAEAKREAAITDATAHAV